MLTPPAGPAPDPDRLLFERLRQWNYAKTGEWVAAEDEAEDEAGGQENGGKETQSGT